MPQNWFSQSSDDPDDIDTWMAGRNAQLALQPEADAAARNLWNLATQKGDDLYAGNPSDLTAIGLAALGGAGPYFATVANDDQNGGDGASAVDGAAPPQDGGASTATGLGGGLYQPATDGGSQSASSLPQIQSAGPGSSASGAAYPSVSEVDVIGQPTTETTSPSVLDSLNHSSIARGAAGLAGYLAGLPTGVLRAGWDAVEGVGHGLNFVHHLLDSSDARAEAWNDAQTTAHDVLQYGRSVFADPSRLASDVVSGVGAANRGLNPLATPIPETASDAFGHELGIGANTGETLTNIAGAFAAPEVAAGIDAARTFAATREANVAKFMGQGFDEPTARYLSKPYDGMGDHALISRSQNAILGFKTSLLKNVPIPDWIKDSPLNVSKPRGMSQGDFYEYHYGVDPQFYGAGLPRDLNGGKGWSGKRLGAERYSGAEQLWAKTPPFWKDYATGTTLGDTLGLLPPNDTGTP
ncbi:MAG TPA: hypothetical protein VGG92_09110 [Caulobacteraceae bacterium]|jgi:hypothetical protein